MASCHLSAQVGHVPVRRQGKMKRRFNAIGDFVFSQGAITRVASFNTRTLTAQWKQNELMAYLEQQRIALCAIQEHRIVHKEEVRDLQLAGGRRLVTSSADAAGVKGVGFALSPKASKTLSRSIAVSPRILWLQFTGAASVNSSQVKSQVKSVKTHVISVRYMSQVTCRFPQACCVGNLQMAARQVVNFRARSADR